MTVFEGLSLEQAHALFDILSHYETYQELRDLRIPGTLGQSGPPFKTKGELNQMPLLYSLFSNFTVPLPGLREVSTDFYQAKCQEIIQELAQVNLSESYEVGYIGIRKTLATGTAAALEAPGRGYYGGLPKKDLSRKDGRWDKSVPEDVIAGFSDFLQRLVYDGLIEEMFAKAAETDQLEDHDPLVQVAHEYILIIIASFLHYVLVISPEGQTIFTMMKRANTIVPYTAIRQTLKIGNAATMIHGMIKLVLTKMTINSMTTFMGLTHASDGGWNLLQTIVSTIVNWNTSDLKRRCVEIEKSDNGPKRAQLEVLRSYVDMNREEHEKCRTMSEVKAEPIAATVMNEYGGDKLSEEQIPLALEYLSVQLSLRDRQKITDVLCSRQPDLFTQAVREGVVAYDPIIRALHNAVDLSGTVGDLQIFLDDLLRFALSSKDISQPSLGDFVQLLKKHQGASHRFIHQVCKNGPELSNWYREYTKKAATKFQVKDHEQDSGGAGKLTSELNNAVSKLSEKQREEVLVECNAHAAYLVDLSRSSKDGIAAAMAPPEVEVNNTTTSKIDTRISSPDGSELGPGIFLRRWQAYINETAITPTQLNGPVRQGNNQSVINAGHLPASGFPKVAAVQAAKSSEVRAAPGCAKTIGLLGAKFREILRESRNS